MRGGSVVMRNRGFPGAFSAALALGLAIGFADAALSMVFRHLYPAYLPVSVAATAVFIAVLYLLLWIGILALTRPFAYRDSMPISIPLSIFLGVFFFLALMARMTGPLLSAGGMEKLAILFVMASFVTLLSQHPLRLLKQDITAGNVFIDLLFAAPFLFAELALFVSLVSSRSGGGLSLSGVALWVGYVALAALTYWFLRGAYRRVGRAVPNALLLVAVIVTALFSTPDGIVYGREEVRKTTPVHPIRQVILILVDSLRADHLSCYGAGALETPSIDRLAAGSVVFEDALAAAPWTLPSMASIVTGVDPSVHMTTDWSHSLPDELVTVAELMRRSGYVTAALGINPVLGPKSNFAQGFDEYDFYPKPVPGHTLGLRLLRSAAPGLIPVELTTSGLTERAVAWIRSHQEDDFFLWIHYYDPHLPYSPPVEFLPDTEPTPSIGSSFNGLNKIRGGQFAPDSLEKSWIHELYASEIRYVDDSIGKLIDSLDKLGLVDDALIILTSDHGEEFWEHGGFEHGHTLYREVLSVPLIIKLPGSEPARIHRRVSLANLMPTILESCGIEYDRNAVQSQSLLGLIDSGAGEAYEVPLFASGNLYYEPQESVVQDDMKYILWKTSGREELFDLVKDPDESTSVLASDSRTAARARRLLHQQHEQSAELRRLMGIESPESARLDNSTLDRLRSLGYIQ
jgi:arylsulfatase A-like enzyme